MNTYVKVTSCSGLLINVKMVSSSYSVSSCNDDDDDTPHDLHDVFICLSIGTPNNCDIVS